VDYGRVPPTIKYSVMLIVPLGVFEMIPEIFEWEIILYEIIQVSVAFIAVVLALKWKKSEFLAGLFFLLIYAIIDMVDVFFSTITQVAFLNVASFGFILLSIIFFIIGMHHSWHPGTEPTNRKRETKAKSSSDNSIFSIIRKI
jgi:cellulose synthase/poly-beta-1,6-N-acetylglucosamine synthase-like glycosyltransferase